VRKALDASRGQAATRAGGFGAATCTHPSRVRGVLMPRMPPATGDLEAEWAAMVDALLAEQD
jgi:hypothetical protein